MSSLENDQLLLSQLKIGDNNAFEQLYRDHYYKVKQMLFKNNGTDDDAKEVFQDTMLVLFKKVRESDFNLTVQLGTYIYAISHNIWLKKIRDGKLHKMISIVDTDLVNKLPDDVDIESISQNYEQKHIVISEIITQLKKECRDIIDAAFYKKMSGATIAKILGYTEDFVKVKKYRCMQELKTLVKSNQLFKI
jgi:RNA polymerase sigma factor (sigma-70 family)